MRILISGYVLGEGRFSMVQTARAIYTHLKPLLEAGDEAELDGPATAAPASVLDHRSLAVKFKKRVWSPLRLRLKRYDVAHVVDSDYAANIPLSRAERTVVTCHDLMPLLVAERLDEVFPKRAGRHFFNRSLLRMAQCARVTCISEFTRRCVLEHTACSPDRVCVVYLAPGERFRPLNGYSSEVSAFIRNHGLDGKRVVLHVGATERYKNVDTVLTVFGKLAETLGQDLVLLKVGGRFTAEQKALAERHGVADRIVHLTGLSEEDVVLAYHSADLLLFPSLFEGFGLPVVEAMACGTPVVCSNGGALPETAGDAAAVHDPRDVEGFVASCRRVLEDEVYAAQLRERGLKQAGRFTWSRTAAAYYDIYREVNQEASE